MSVALLMGSDSDFPRLEPCVKTLRELEIPCEVRVLSAHRTPEQATAFARDASANGLKLVIAGAGGSAHLAGVIAAHTTLPVIGVPLAGSPLGGFDSLLSTVQMPPGIPVATVGVGPMGAKNAGHLAAAILALSDRALRARLARKRQAMTEDVLKKGAALPARLRELLSK